jgi:hypothetical protein
VVKVERNAFVRGQGLWNFGDHQKILRRTRSCLVSKGTIHSGRKVEIVFEFTPKNISLVESFYLFIVPEQNIKVHLLLVGTVHEPEVKLDRTHVNFNALLLGEFRELLFSNRILTCMPRLY